MDRFSIAGNVEQEFMDIVFSIDPKIRKIQGILNLDPFQLAEEYFESKVVADASIDANANVSGKSPVNFQSEIFKPQLKLRSYYHIWKRLVKAHGNAKADEMLRAMLDGTIYFHDITKSDLPYCFAFDTSFVMHYGRPYGWLPGKAPKRSSSFMGQLVETTMDWSQELAGAVGLANLLVNLAYYTNKERKELMKYASIPHCNPEVSIAMFVAGLGYSSSIFNVDTTQDDIVAVVTSLMQEGMSVEQVTNIVYDKYVEDLLQQFVHVMHNTFRVGGDSPFTNVSIFDRKIIESMFGQALYPDTSMVKKNVEEIIRVQNIFIEFFVKGSPVTNKKYRFPVATINLKKWSEDDFELGLCQKTDIGKIADYEYFKYLAEKNLERGTFNWHVGEKIASCCFSKDQMALTRNTITGVRYDTFENLWKERKGGNNFKVFHNGSWVHGRLIRVPARNMFKVVTANGKTVLVTDNHINPTFDGDKPTSKLTTEDYLMFNTSVLDRVPESDLKLTYEQGLLIGMYLGDGSGVYDMTNSTCLSLSLQKLKDSEDYLNTALSQICGVKSTITVNKPINNCYSVSLPNAVREFIQHWVSGSTSNTKELNLNCLLQSVEFRRGIIDGYVLTDGDYATKTLIYSSSKTLLEQVETVLTSLGVSSRIYLDSEAGRKVVIRDEEYNSNYDIWCLSMYSKDDNTRNYKDLFRKKNNSIYFKVSSIEPVSYTDEYVYCFEMRNQDEPYFTLPNGIITHNCRLTSDLAELKNDIRTDSFGNGGISIGSHRVVALNLHRIALESKYTNVEVMSVMNKYMEMAKFILVAHKELLAERVESGFLKFFNLGWCNMSQLFSTFGFTGLWDMFNVLNEYGSLQDYTNFASDVLEFMDEYAKQSGRENDVCAFNVEEIPKVAGALVA